MTPPRQQSHLAGKDESAACGGTRFNHGQHGEDGQRGGARGARRLARRHQLDVNSKLGCVSAGRWHVGAMRSQERAGRQQGAWLGCRPCPADACGMRPLMPAAAKGLAASRLHTCPRSVGEQGPPAPGRAPEHPGAECMRWWPGCRRATWVPPQPLPAGAAACRGPAGEGSGSRAARSSSVGRQQVAAHHSRSSGSGRDSAEAERCGYENKHHSSPPIHARVTWLKATT